MTPSNQTRFRQPSPPPEPPKVVTGFRLEVRGRNKPVFRAAGRDGLYALTSLVREAYRRSGYTAVIQAALYREELDPHTGKPRSTLMMTWRGFGVNRRTLDTLDAEDDLGVLDDVPPLDADATAEISF